jgi:hypothetical protein
MSKRTTRRALSVRGATYQRIKSRADAQGKSVSGLLEDLIAEKMDELGVPEEKLLRPRESKDVRPRVSLNGHFTF